MRSVMQHKFSNVPRIGIPRSTFDRPSGIKTCFDCGYIVPIFCDEYLPGDTAKVSLFGLGRLSTPLYPIMDNMIADVHFFSVPLWMIDDTFMKMMGERINPDDDIDYLCPTINSPASTGYAEDSLFDYLGLPTKIPDLEHNAYFHRAYNKIFNEWYRDQNIQDSVVVDTDAGPDDPADYVLLKRNKRHDYFTSCLPWPQKGDSIDIPLGTSAPVEGLGKSNQTFSAGPVNVYETDGSGTVQYTGASNLATGFYGEEDPNNTGYLNIRTNLTNATAATINQLRQAFQVQRLLERDARSGTRYKEVVLAHFQVVSDDARIMRSEYLGGGSAAININPIAYTALNSTAQITAGDLGAMGTMTFKGQAGFTKSFTEHSVVLGLISVRSDLTYQQGLDRMFSRSTRYDFYWPSLATIGEQAVLTKEIYAQGSLAATDDDVFGYQERYGEYRYKNSKITGRFRSNCTAPLDAWHLSQEFTSTPTLSESFIQENPPMDRVLAVTTEPHIIFDGYFTQRTARPMPMYGVPGLIDHF